MRDAARVGKREPLQPGRRAVLIEAGWLLLAIPVAAVALACGESGESRRAAPAGQAPAAPGSGPPPAEAPSAGSAGASALADDRLVTEIPELKDRVEALHYAHQSPKPDQQCADCQFYLPRHDHPGRGDCQVFQQGLVEEGGWCTSYVKRQPSS